jgi:urease gamma subunit
VWLVWSERIEIYMGLHLAMVRSRGGLATVIEHPSTWPFHRILDSVAEALRVPTGQTAAKTHNALRKVAPKSQRLHITVGSGLCKTGSFVVPQGVKRYSEVQSLAQAAAVQSCESNDVMGKVDPMNPGLVASVATRTLSDLKAWAGSLGVTIESLQPLWSVGTQCALACDRKISGLILSEPDGITLIASSQTNEQLDGNKAASILTIPIETFQEAGQAHAHLMSNQVQMQIQRWKIANGLQNDAVLTLNFGASVSTTKTKGLPAVWNRHWSHV